MNAVVAVVGSWGAKVSEDCSTYSNYWRIGNIALMGLKYNPSYIPSVFRESLRSIKMNLHALCP